MTDINGQFSRLIETTLPAQERLEAAKSAPNEVREHLKKHDLETLDPHTRLIGSYKRSTAVQGLKDVDILVFLDTDEQSCTPDEALKRVRDALNDLPDSSSDDTRKQNRSVRITMSAWDISLDIIPALGFNEGNLLPLRIPDREADEWIDTNPLRFEDLLTELNKAHDRRVKPLIRLFKVWRNEHFIYKSPKSYWLEVLTYNAVRSGIVRPEDGYAQAYRDLLQHAVNALAPYVDAGLTPSLLDPVLGVDITGDWPLSHWESFLTRLQEHLSYADEALAQEGEEAFKSWQKVFGDAWPEEDSKESSALHRAILAGAAAVSPSGTVFSSKPDSTPSIGVRAAKAYGGNRSRLG